MDTDTRRDALRAVDIIDKVLLSLLTPEEATILLGFLEPTGQYPVLRRKLRRIAGDS